MTNFHSCILHNKLVHIQTNHQVISALYMTTKYVHKSVASALKQTC